MCICHKCDVRNCINPDHLFIGTQLDNIADMDAKGRRRTLSGRESPRSLDLSPEDSRQIIKLCKTKSQLAVAKLFEISQQTVSNIVRGMHWSVAELSNSIW
jgi:hypothetical protein